jgi:hypothetical protein
MKMIRVLTLLLTLLALPASSLAFCPFCESERGPTLMLQIEDAAIVLYGHFESSKITDVGLDQGEAVFVIENVLKTHPMIEGKKKLTLPRYITSLKTKFVIFADVYQGKIDPYKGTQLTKDSEMLKYVDGVLKMKDKSQPERLRFAFDFLNSPESEVALDAYREYARADYKDYKDMATKLPANQIADWLRDPKTPQYRYGLYSSLLGHCGTPEHAKMLLDMINDPEKQKASGLHGLMAAYTMLEPQKGWKLLKELVQDKDKPFLFRYQGLQTMRFLWESRPDLIAKEDKAAKDEIVKGVAGVLKVADMADFGIEDLRKWQRWEYCDTVLGMFGQKDFNTPIIRKAVLRYALQCQLPQATAFVNAQKARDREWVEETKELLDLETPAATVAPTTK